jgi:hypothetical protein
MTLLYHLLRDGYFPKELPPVFNTYSYSELICSSMNHLPSYFNVKKTKSVEHNIPFKGASRRKLSIPNPIAYFFLCKKIDESWTELEKSAASSRLSKSKPIRAANPINRALKPNSEISDIPKWRVQYRMGSRYLLKTDVRNFYHSIYTHSIPWAMHTKLVAKKNKNSPDLLGNNIDKLVRNCQDLQTIGIPIGPDTSYLISEILLSCIDNIIINEFKEKTNSELKGFRWMDDYELSFSNSHHAEIALNCIDSALSQFELGLNPSKTKIIELPIALEERWARELKIFKIRDSEKAQLNDVISFFSRAFELAEEYREKPVLRYAISRFRSMIINKAVKKTVWPTLQDLMLECVINEPGTISYVINSFVNFSNNGYEMKLDLLRDVLNYQINNHASLGHGSEVAWSLWGSILFNLQINADTAKAISKIDDSIVTLLALDAESRGLFEEPLEKSHWSQYMNNDALYGEQWLLSYEANVENWIPSEDKDHVDSDNIFNFLKINGVRFYSSSMATKKMPFKPVSEEGNHYDLSN